MRTYSHVDSKWLPKIFLRISFELYSNAILFLGQKPTQHGNERRRKMRQWISPLQPMCNLILKTYLELIDIKIVQRIHTHAHIVSSSRLPGPRWRDEARYVLFFDCLFSTRFGVDEPKMSEAKMRNRKQQLYLHRTKAIRKIEKKTCTLSPKQY